MGNTLLRNRTYDYADVECMLNQTGPHSIQEKCRKSGYSFTKLKTLLEGIFNTYAPQEIIAGQFPHTSSGTWALAK